MYLTYDEYKNYGGTVDKAAFDRFAFDAQKLIDSHTHNRIDEPNEVVKRCMSKLIDVLQKTDIEEQSFSHDGVSQTIKKPAQSEISDKVNGIVYNYLIHETDKNGTPLLYRGVNRA